MPKRTKNAKRGAASKQQQNANRTIQPNRTRRINQNNKGGLSPAALNYLVSCLFPSVHAGRIPDASACPTSEVSLTYDFTFLANGTGVGGCRLFCAARPYVQVESSTTTDSVFAYETLNYFPADTSYIAGFSASRLVSAELHVMSTNADLANGGKFMSAVVNGNYYGTYGTTPISVPQILSTRENLQSRLDDGVVLTYRSLDPSSYFFRGTAETANQYLMVVHVTGVQSATIFTCRVVMNYESLANADTLGYQKSTNSPVDVNGLNRVESVLSKVSPITTYSEAVKSVGKGLNNMASATKTALELFRALS